MLYGILNEPTCRDLFEQINCRSLCADCRTARIRFASHDQKHNSCYSNLLPGFSSEWLAIPVDILIVSAAHGGGRKTDFHQPQWGIDCEVDYFGSYYLRDPLEKFNQQQIRMLLKRLDHRRKTWVFTDLIKSYVWHGRDRENNLDGNENRNLAIKYCRVYLDEQIEIFRPKNILCLRNMVAKEYFGLRGSLKHGSVHEVTIRNQTYSLVFSIFPSGRTADHWVRQRGWKSILQKLG